MNYRAAFVFLLVTLSPCAMAEQRATKAASTDEAAAARAQLEQTQGQVQAEDANVRKLKEKVDALESGSDKAARDLAERDRKIAELRKQLAAGQHP